MGLGQSLEIGLKAGGLWGPKVGQDALKPTFYPLKKNPFRDIDKSPSLNAL